MKRLRFSGLLAGGGLQLAVAAQVPEPIEFEQRFLRPGAAGNVDLSVFSQPARVLPGDYWLQVQVNQRPLGRLLIPYRQGAGEAGAHGCFDRPLLRRLGVAVDALPKGGAACRRLEQWLPGAAEHLDFPQQRLALDIPQAWQVREPDGFVGAESWDWGVTSAFSSYDLSVFDVDSGQGSAHTQTYAGLSSGLNLGRWHWRHQGSLSSDGGYQTLSHYLQREVAPWGAQLRLGQVTTQGDLLDAQQLRGIHLFSDDRMLPASQRGYAPVVRGVARGNARVAIRQGERLLREVVVPPGAFVIDDLYAASVGGDLQVTVSEADGSEQRFTVTNAAAPLALREGRSRFGLSVGQLQEQVQAQAPWFAQGTWQQGLSDSLTGYMGTTLAADYQQWLLGSALNTPVGAVGLDLARAQADGEQGGRLRLSYGTLLMASDTRLGLGYQQATGPGYRTLAQAYDHRALSLRERARTTASINQPLGSAWGQLNGSAWHSSSWEGGGARLGYSLGYANRFADLGYVVTASRERDLRGRDETVWQLNLSLPLGGGRGNLTAGLNQSSQGHQAQAGYRNGTDRYNYGVSVSEGRGTAQFNGFGGWRAPYGELSASLGQGDRSRQVSAGARGAVVAHPGGVTFAQPLAETFAIVEVPEAKGARVVNGNQVRVDGRGHAIVPQLVPYQLNRVEVDPTGLPLDVELATNSQQVAPRAGAVPLLRYPTRTGRTALIDLRLAAGGGLPFGAQVSDDSGAALGVVGQGSRVLARGLHPKGQLQVQWGDQQAQRCVADYEMETAGKALQVMKATCVPEQGKTP